MDTIRDFRSPARLTGNTDLYISSTESKGRGVFAGRCFRKGELIERCCIIELDQGDHYRFAGNILERYVFLWDKRKKSLALALGFGSLYNHSPEPNCSYTREINQKILTFRARQDILPHEEITIHYGPAGESFNPKT
ncbi:SET domain-containing protein-lysine N-methyltransferase [Algoriphagus sp. AK58]|uniref:SET domain-containing protein-lysine N-methyltransferase n=2 Tax=unclassified Algoriphagus TaxID=2641541 RepID=UPI00164F499D|nr:SET domain-containing protein-lysine N-methyltransferase [Algoriphagus sp. AK58]MBC6368329.1 SET domain-containing protein-lysine N-methyltransferase [Algoriphagus sp. AK58]